MGPASFLPPCPPSATLAVARSLLAPAAAAAAADAASAETNPQRVCPEKPGLLEQGLCWLTLPDGREGERASGQREGTRAEPASYLPSPSPPLTAKGGRQKAGGRGLGLSARVCGSESRVCFCEQAPLSVQSGTCWGDV